jgi:hypothetical protein
LRLARKEELFDLPNRAIIDADQKTIEDVDVRQHGNAP